MIVQDSTHTIGRSLSRFFSGTLISRFTGLAREVGMAIAFGTTPSVAAFWMAFRFAHLLRRLFGEGALHVAFVPHFESLNRQDPLLGARFFFNLSSALTALLFCLIVIAELILGGFLYFCPLEPNSREVIALTMVMLPALIFVCLYALNTSLLNCRASYFLPSVAPSLLNLIWVGAIFLLYQLPSSEAIAYLAMTIVFAFVLQWAATLPPVFSYLRNSDRQKWDFHWIKELLYILKPFALGTLGVAATQLNSAIDTLFARFADPEGPAYLWYALRLQQLPFGLIGVGITSALLPPLSRAIKEKNQTQYSEFLTFGVKQGLLVMLPLSIAIFALGFSGINLIYGHGAFSQVATIETTRALWAYGLGLLPMTFVLILATAFYAHKDYRTPTLTALFTIGLNITLNALFVFLFHWKATSIALATTCASWVNFFLLLHFFKKRHLFLGKDLRSLSARLILASLLAAICSLIFGKHFLQDPTLNIFLSIPPIFLERHSLQQLIAFCFQAVLFSALFLMGAYLLKLREFLLFFKK